MAAPVTAIVGLGRDVGIAIARRLDKAGHKLIVAGNNTERLEKAVANLSHATAYNSSELHTTLGLRNCLATGLEAYGRVDHLIFIPPISGASSLSDLEMEQFDKSFARSARSAVLALRIFADHFQSQEDEPAPGAERIRQKGTITFVLSLAGLSANPEQFTATVTQKAMLGIMQASAVELAPAKIRCNAIAALRPRAEDNEPWLKQRTPLGRAALADEIADAALYLISPEAAIITGETLTLDGGRSALGGLADN